MSSQTALNRLRKSTNRLPRPRMKDNCLHILSVSDLRHTYLNHLRLIRVYPSSYLRAKCSFAPPSPLPFIYVGAARVKDEIEIDRRR